MSKLAIKGGLPLRSKPFHPWPVFDAKDEHAVLEAMRSGQWGRIGAKRNLIFEDRFATWVGAKYAVTCVNGTAAIQIALSAAGIQRDDEVIVPAYTFIATASAAMILGAHPIMVDINPETYCINSDLIEAAITPKTKAIIPVHMGGTPANLDKICAIARKYNLRVIEDSAQAHGAEWKNKRVGTFGDLSTFSFQSGKNLSCGEGGIIVTSNEKLADLSWSYMNVGRVKQGGWYDHPCLGWNYRLTELQAALLMTQMDKIEDQMAARDKNADYLDSQLRKENWLIPLVMEKGATRSAHHIYIMKYKKENFGNIHRDVFIKALQAEGVPCFPGYIPLYKFAAISQWPFITRDYQSMHLPETEKASYDEGIWLSQNMLLGTREDMDDILKAIEKIHQNLDELT